MPGLSPLFDASSRRLTRSNFLMTVLLTLLASTVNGFTVNVKYPNSSASSRENTKYVTD